jgi:hypothetical protein
MKTLAMFLLGSVLFGAVVAPAAGQNTSAWTEGGLVRRDVPGIDTAFVLPGAALSDYKKVMLKPVEVSFRRGFLEQPRPGSRLPISARDAQDIRDRLARLMQDEFRRELTAGGYQVVDAPGEDTLAVEAAIVNLFINAPTATPATRTFAVSAGEMSLVAQLSDSLSGAVLARIFDHASANESLRAQRITNVENEAEARRIVGGWARVLRQSLDAAHALK